MHFTTSHALKTKPDLVLIDKKKRICHLVDFAFHRNTE